jgi:hypothetical protein
MDNEKILKEMEIIQDEYREVLFHNPELEKNGFFLCGLFGNILKQYDILLLGTNPGGYDRFDDINSLHTNEIDSYKENFNYNELVVSKDKLSLKTREFYKQAFEEEQIKYLNNTFYWNMCLLRNEKKYSDLDDAVKELGFSSFWELFRKIIGIVKPKIIITFIEVFDFLNDKLNFTSNNTTLDIENSKAYYNKSSSLNIDKNLIRSIIGIPHLTGYPYTPLQRIKFAQKFKIDCHELL